MPPDSTSVFTAFKDFLALPQTLVAIFVGLATLATAFFTKVLPWWRTRRDRRSLAKHCSEYYTSGVIERSTQFYIEPLCQDLDPAGSEEPRRVAFIPKVNLFKVIDDLLGQQSEHRYLILLADSGMGKTSFLLNYYARHLRKRRQFEIALVPLGIPDADARIQQITNKRNTVLFLDALDEDTLAIVDHKERLRHLLGLTRDFNRVLLTCRTQFFPKDEEIPQETGIVKLGPRAAGEKAQYAFHKLYLSPFTNEQVQQYLHRLYPVWQPQWRKRSQEMVDKIPNLIVRPMLLSYIDDLVRKGRTITHAFELYEEMVAAWLMREEGIFPALKQEPLRQFSERLAVDLYMNRERRGAERIPLQELAALAKEWKIPLEDWALSGRSLLNRDAGGNYKFAHRSIMEYLVAKRFVERDSACAGMELTDLMKAFIQELLKSRATVVLRAQPAVHLQEKEVQAMLEQHKFFDTRWNREGVGIGHRYECIEIQEEKLVLDFTTGLMWQQSGSPKPMIYSDAEKYARELNAKHLAGYDDWRLPTLEEAMSLMEREKKNGVLFIDPIFDHTQQWIWTADKSSGSSCWVAYFNDGGCYDHRVGSHNYVRLVR